MLKIFVLLLLLLGLNELYADNGWSEPVLISGQNNGYDTALLIDRNGKFHLFFCNYSSNQFGRLVVRESVDNGVSWGAISELTTNTSNFPCMIKPVADRDNNIHLVYRHTNNGTVYYLKKNSNSWSNPIQIEPRVDTNMQLFCDNTNRIYMIGNIYKYAYYKYLENNTWTQFKPVNDSLMMFEYSGTMDINNNLHLFGMSYLDSLPAHYCQYDKNQEKWTKFTDLSSNMLPSLILDGVIANKLTPNPKLNIVSAAGNYAEVSTTYYRNSILYSDVWSQPEQINEQLDMFHKHIIVDQNNELHIFDLSADLHKLYHFYQYMGIWQNEIIYLNNEFQISDYLVEFYENEIYLIYQETLPSISTKIYLIKKTVTTAINNDHYELKYNFLNCYPNPFNNSTQINFVLPQISNTKLEIFNAKGELVQTLFTGKLKSGNHSFNFNATGLNSGVYYCCLIADSEVITTKLMLLK